MTNVTTPSNTEAAKAEPVFDDPIGITDPPIDELLDKVSSKYALVIFAAKRARQINSYYQEQDEGVFEFVGPCLLYTSPSPRDATLSRMPSSA